MTLKAAERVVVGLCIAIFIQISAIADSPGGDARRNGRVDLATATTVAQRHLLRLNVAAKVTLGEGRFVRETETGPALYYWFDVLPRGHVVVCGARTLPPVIAYSFTSEARDDLGPTNPLADLLGWDLRARLAEADLLPSAVVAQRRAAWAEFLDADPLSDGGRSFQQWPAEGSTPTGGWVVTNWTQSAPYNNQCPMDLVVGARSVAGCPAVAMAQIVHYHARLNGTHFTNADDYYHNYGGNQFWIDDAYLQRSFPSWPQLNSRLTTLFDNYFHGTPPTDFSKAALVYACGVAAHQVYSASGSGTFGVSQAFDAYQKFGCGTTALLHEEDPDLPARLSQNMVNGFPAHLAVVNESWTVGHNLVVDGYNTDEYYHFNFGWGGAYNGWYQLLDGLPYQLTVIEGVIVDIMTDACLSMDGNCDGIVGWTDFTYLAGCLAGPANAYGAPGCGAFDADADGDVDLADFHGFQLAYNP